MFAFLWSQMTILNDNFLTALHLFAELSIIKSSSFPVSTLGNKHKWRQDEWLHIWSKKIVFAIIIQCT